MTRILPLIALALPLAACAQPDGKDGATQTPTVDDGAVAALSQPVASEFTTALQAQLSAAMAQGGAMQAVGVCHEAAPRLLPRWPMHMARRWRAYRIAIATRMAL